MLKPALRPPMRAPSHGALALNEGVGAAAYAPFPAAPGWQWEFVVDYTGARYAHQSSPVVIHLLRVS